MNENEKKRKKAVALTYSMSNNAPIISAKGTNEPAETIIQLAKDNNIPIHEDRDLIEILYTLELGYEIPEQLYKAIAEILSFIYLANREYEKFLSGGQ